MDEKTTAEQLHYYIEGEFENTGVWTGREVADKVMAIVSDMSIRLVVPESQPRSCVGYETFNQWGEHRIIHSLDELDEV